MKNQDFQKKKKQIGEFSNESIQTTGMSRKKYDLRVILRILEKYTVKSDYQVT